MIGLHTRQSEPSIGSIDIVQGRTHSFNLQTTSLKFPFKNIAPCTHSDRSNTTLRRAPRADSEFARPFRTPLRKWSDVYDISDVKKMHQEVFLET